MAEQTSHNVVNESQSASGSPLVDAVANHTTATTATTGNPSTFTTNAEPNPEAKDHANGSNDIILPDSTRSDTGPTAAEPSAGEAAAPPADTRVTKQEDIASAEKDDGQLNDSLMSGNGGSTGHGAGGNEDGITHDVSTDPSVASDTEGGRVEQSKDENRHVRTNSVKKPVSFSKVSVTKNFMAKTATTVPTVPRIGEKAPASTALPNAPKPRLIAKTGASVSALQKARQNADSPSGPDASRVWNKNKAPTPQPAKQFTDEELKQQYGIHLATRLQSDEKTGESKWADIDEDEDDWVPDQVVWVDGTKSSLTPADNTPAPKPAELASLTADKPADKVEKPAEKPAEKASEKPTEAAKPPAPVLKRPSEPAGPPKTILKPGAAAQAKQTGVSSPSPGLEKAVLKAKSPAPAPVKSPWAALPPVERVSPITPPVQQQAPPQPMFASQDARAYESSMPPPQPAREIAADTFDRSWREGEGERRELFNSTNGRYEPAPEGRRSSMKPDSYARKHALLQRPSQSGGEPAGPSSAFQTRSGSQSDGPPAWGRRRGSSVSHAGMPPPRRMSTNKSPEQFAVSDRRSSNAASHEALASPASVMNEQQQPMFSQQSAWQQQMPPPPAPGAQQEDLVKVQDRVMKEKITEARKRRQEEEEKNEAAKQERLKAKLAALEGAGQSRKSRAEAAATPAQETPASELRPADNYVLHNQKSQEPVQPPQITEVASAAGPSLEDQILPPPSIPEAKAPSPEKLELPSPIPKPQDVGLPARSTSSEQALRLTPRAHLSPQAGPRAPFQQNAPSPYRAPTSAYSSPGDRKQQPFNRSTIGSNDAFSPWPTGGSGGNVWGSSGIGNGTFESSPSFGSMPIPQQGSALLPPPGMGRPAASSHMSPQMLGQDSRSPGMQQSPLPDQGRPFGPPGIEPRPDHFMPQPRLNGPSPSPGMGRQQHVPGPIGPPSRAQAPQTQRSGVSAWAQASKEMNSQYSTLAAIGPPKKEVAEIAPARDDTIREVFKQRQPNGKYSKPAHIVHDANGTRAVAAHAPAPPSTQTQPSVPVPTASPLNVHGKQPGESTVRIPDGSMNPAHGGRPAQQLPIGAPRQPSAMRNMNINVKAEPQPPAVSSKEQSPPPPEAAAHPAHAGDPKHPHVRLPQAKPRVRLPPAAVPIAQQQQPVVMPQRPMPSWGPPGAARPLVQSEAWQARFNGLFNRIPTHTETPPSPPKTPPKMQDASLAVNSATRMAMDDPAAAAATVSLPQVQIRKITTPEGFTIDESDQVTSKEAIEPLFNEELSFGSKPTTRVPHNAVYSEVNLSSKHNLLTMGPNSKLIKSVEPHSREPEVQHLYPVDFKGVHVSMPHIKIKHHLVYWRRGPQKPAGRFNKGKGPAGISAPATKDSNPSSPVSSAPNGNSATHSRKASYQKAHMSTNAPVPNQNVPAAGPANSAPQNGGKRPSNYKGRGGRQQSAAHAAPAPVKST